MEGCLIMKRMLVFLLIVMMINVNASAVTIRIPENVTVIEEEAFFADHSVEYITLPESLSEIHDRAFIGTGITSIELPDNLTYIAKNAFEPNISVTVTEGTYSHHWAIANNYDPIVISETGNTIDLTRFASENVYRLMMFIRIEKTDYNKYFGSTYRNGSLEIKTTNNVPCQEMIQEINIDSCETPRYSLFGIDTSMKMGEAKQVLLDYVENSSAISEEEAENRRWKYFRTDNENGERTGWGFERYVDGAWQVIWLYGRYGAGNTSKIQRIEYSCYPKTLPVYRALLIGEVNTDCESNASRFKRSVDDMDAALSTVNSGLFETLTKYDLEYRDFLGYIEDVFSQADDNDVTLLFVATHGEGGAAEGSDPGDLTVTGGRFVKLKEISDTLAKYKGTKVVIIDACLAGNAATQGLFQEKNTIAITGGNIGESTSIGWWFGSVNVFSYTVQEAIGTSGSMPADTDDYPENVVNVDELYTYLKEHVEKNRDKLEFGLSLGPVHTPSLISGERTTPLFWR